MVSCFLRQLFYEANITFNDFLVLQNAISASVRVVSFSTLTDLLLILNPHLCLLKQIIQKQDRKQRNRKQMNRKDRAYYYHNLLLAVNKV